ncbi:MAG: thioredoxin [Treponema sp.]|jgi:thioredoxin 1|nr:thioredoxin [Treponema sp.]
MSEAVTLTSGNFQSEVLESGIPVLVDFWAEWCRPCKMLAPVLDQIAGEYQDKIKLCKVNVDEESGLANQHDVVSIPTVVVYQGGKIVNRQVGALPKAQIEALFRDLIA